MIRFLLDDEPVELDPSLADLTVLDWLRLHRGRTGTKEGCGSGDCGACTVIVASLDDTGDALRRETVNACIAFVGSLHGRQLLTIESLADGERLHPAQRAMIDEHGSQCGFCTPGFVMSIAALCASEEAPVVARVARTVDAAGDADAPRGAARAGASEASATPVAESRSPAAGESVAGPGGHADAVRTRTDAGAGRPITMTEGWLDGLGAEDAQALGHRIDRALGGNLCRCTGYRSIRRAAAVALCEGPMPFGSDDRVVERLRTLDATVVGGEEPAPLGWLAPRSLAELAELRLALPGVPLVAGSTDLALEVTRSMRRFDTLIHVARVPELQRLDVDDDGATVGAAVSLTRLLAVIDERLPMARELLLRFGSDQIRNRGTVGGNIGSASPIGDLAPVLIALGATLRLQRGETVRELPLEHHFLDYRKTTLREGEFIRAVRFDWPAASDALGVYKISKRYDDDISTVAGAFRLSMDGDRIADARLAFGGMAAIPKRASAAEEALQGVVFDGISLRRARQALTSDFTPLSDARASAGYRLTVAANLLTRFHVETTGEGATRVQALASA